MVHVFCKIRNQTSMIIFGMLFVIYLLFQIIPVSGANKFLGYDSKGIIIEWIEILILAAFVVTLILNLVVIRKFGRSILGMPFIYILTGMIFLILARVFIILYNFEVYNFEDTTLQLGWHIMFYTGMIAFLLAINSVNLRRKDTDLHGFETRDWVILLLLGTINVSVFLGAESIDEMLTDWFADSILDTSGVLHFIAFALAGYLALRLLRIQTATSENELGKLISSFVPAFLLFLGLMSINHFWELITESWGLLEVEDSVIETGEQLFWLPGFFITLYGFRQVIRYSNLMLSTKFDKSEFSQENVNTPIMVDILQILNHHIGSEGPRIAYQSSVITGIQLSDVGPENISEFGNEVQKLTSELIGDFPSRFLNQSIQKAVSK